MSTEPQSSSRPCIVISKRSFIAIVAAILAIVLWLVWPFISDRGPVQYANDEEHFLYGSIGGEDSDGIPYWILKVLPTAFADKLPGEGLTSFGFIQQRDHELPIGFVRSTTTNLLAIDVVTENCAICHVGSLRESATDPDPQIILAMPGFTVDLQSFISFLNDTAADERFTADNLMPYIKEAGANFNPLESLLYRYVVIPQTREAFLEQRHDFSFMERQPPYGPGRIDTFNSYKTRRYGFLIEALTPREINGVADYPSIWNQAPRHEMGLPLHWDGNNDDTSERNRTAAMALASPTTLDFDSMARVRAWLMKVQPPEYPYEIDQALAKRGKVIFNNYCASCHDKTGAKIGQITPIDEIRTDRGRLDSYTYELASNQNLTFSGITYNGVDQRFSHFTKTNGYVNGLLDGVWLRSPYLHNGSVPTLRDLLNKPAARPKTFYRGYDVFDKKNVGYISTLPEENGKKFFLYDTARPGNHNTGHLYGTNLPNEDKDALLEYLKLL